MVRYIVALVLALLVTVSQAQVITTAMLLQLPISSILTAGQWLFSGGEKVYYIEVLGVGKTAEESRLNGFRLAVEQAVGSIIASETEVVNNRIARDEVISYASGYISKYEILWQGRDNTYGHKTQLKVWIKRSIIANRLLHESKVAGDLDGAKASVNLASIQYERQQGDRLVGVVLNDFYRRGMTIELKPSQVRFDNNRNGILIIPFRLSWNKDYLNSLIEAYKVTAQDTRPGQCFMNCIRNVSVVDISGTRLGFSDNTKTTALIQTMILSEPQVELTVFTNQDQVMHKQCFRWAALDHIDDYNQSTYFVDVSKTNIANIRVNSQAFMDTAIQLKTTPNTLEQAAKTQLKLVPKSQCSA
jgi:hypothetical protein